MKLNLEQIKTFLPHRDPFLFIDRVDSIQFPPGIDLKNIESKSLVGTQIKAAFLVKKEMEIFKGHFPGNPILPGVIQIEMMAQASSFAIIPLLKDPFSNTLEVALLAADGAKFRKPVVPGMELEIQSVVARARGSIYSYECKIFHQNELCSETSIMASAKF